VASLVCAAQADVRARRRSGAQASYGPTRAGVTDSRRAVSIRWARSSRRCRSEPVTVTLPGHGHQHHRPRRSDCRRASGATRRRVAGATGHIDQCWRGVPRSEGARIHRLVHDLYTRPTPIFDPVVGQFRHPTAPVAASNWRPRRHLPDVRTLTANGTPDMASPGTPAVVPWLDDPPEQPLRSHGVGYSTRARIAPGRRCSADDHLATDVAPNRTPDQPAKAAAPPDTSFYREPELLGSCRR